jgi:electron transfer flavoprotein alpha subunit
VLERVEGGKHQVSVCAGTPAVLGWATGNLAEPRNNPQVGMANMRTIMPALAKAKAAKLEANGLSYISVEPAQTAAHHARGEEHDPRRDRRRAGRVDWSRIMENILVLDSCRRNRLSPQQSLAGSRHCRPGAGRAPLGSAHHRHCAVDATTAASALAVHRRAPLAVSGEAFAQARYATDAAAAEALCRAANATIVLAPGTSRFTRIAAGVAHRLGGFIDTHITALSGTETIEASRWFYRQRIEAVSAATRAPGFCCSTRAPTRPLRANRRGSDRSRSPSNCPAQRTTVSGFRAPAQDAQTIRPDAKLLFVAGAGWTKKQPDGQVHAAEAGELILGFLHATSASLGSSKSLVDQGGEGNSVLPFLTHLNQIGQTGATPRHAKGLSTCCHGEEPHVVGWRFIGSTGAPSRLDPNCGWTRGKADVVYVADAFPVMAKLNALLEAAKM